MTKKQGSLGDQVLHDVLRRHINLEMMELREYAEEIEHYFAQQQKKLLERYEREVEKYPAAQEDIAEYLGEEKSRIEEIFLRSFRYSMIIAAHSVLEVLLEDLCRHAQRLHHQTKSVRDLGNDGIARAKRYLKTIAKISFPENTNAWQQIEKSLKIRNCIVHTQGNIKKTRNPKALRNLVKSIKGITLDGADRFIHIDSTYVPALIDNIETCVQHVYRSF